MSKVYFGIDLGTSSSSISYISDSPRAQQNVFIEPETIRFSPPPGATIFHNWQRLPSMLHIAEKGGSRKLLVGFQAEEAAKGKLVRPFENLFISVKSDMGTLKVYEDSVSPDIMSPVEVSAEIIRELIRAAEKETGVSPKKAKVVITVPASFTHGQRQDTLRAARLAGLAIDDGDLLDEPVAAFIHTACHQKFDAQLNTTIPKKVLMFDLGAGTCDISIFDVAYDPDFLASGIGLDIKNRAISNYEKLGGDNLDLHIVEKEILPAFCKKNGLDFNELPEKIKREIRFRLKPKARQIKEEICRQISQDWGRKDIRQPWTIDSFVIPGQQIKSKKVTAVTALQRFMELMSPFITDDVKQSIKIADDYLTYSFFGPVLNALKKAKIGPEDIDAFIFNGGSCHNPVIRKAFEVYEGFLNAKFFETPDLDLSVSKGAAIHCYLIHKYGEPLVTPIVNSEIGIYTLGLKKERLVSAGTELPFPANGDFYLHENFFVPKDSMDSVGISIYSGEGTVISNLKLPLPAGTMKGEPICIGLSIDRNKVMTLKAFMKSSPEVRIDAELSNPWTHRISTSDDMAVNELWIKVTRQKKERQVVSAVTMIDLANRERSRKNCDGAVEILQRLEDKGTNTAELNNLLGLCYNQLGQKERALTYFRKGLELSPDDVTYSANYGSQLLTCGNTDEAVSQLLKSVDLEPDNYFPHFWLGYAYREQGREDLARKEFEKSQQILQEICARYPESDYHLDFLRNVTVSLGEYETAEGIRRRINDINNTKIFNEIPDRLVAGPDSGIWKEDEVFEDKEAF
ncbi:MAG: Hsp70 family protein [Nitrospirae bacterium]|nr:Hsp70 family protein [Nitrospirota bacterium]